MNTNVVHDTIQDMKNKILKYETDKLALLNYLDVKLGKTTTFSETVAYADIKLYVESQQDLESQKT